MQTTRLGYVGFEVSDVAAWERFATEVVGLRTGTRFDDGSVAFRADARSHRWIVHPGKSDDLAYAGFEFDDEATLTAAVARLRANGHDVRASGREKRDARGVVAIFETNSPDGNAIELYTGAATDPEPFVSPLATGGFVTDAGGIGHIVLGAVDRTRTVTFYREMLGMRLSDEIKVALGADFTLEISFLRANERHHTIAIAGVALPKRIDHVMLEMRSRGDVGRAYDRCIDARVPISRSLGEHPNDGMFSFYVHTPSGFDLEIGYGGIVVDDATWQVKLYRELSTWGHRTPGGCS
jgi:2,3-dihydroxybiphenyl 1,2-dioxygenase